jgi:hypothetical protein
MEIIYIINSLKKIIETFDKIDNLIDLGRTYYRLVIFNKVIRMYIPNNLFQKYITQMDSILYESYLGDELNKDKYIEKLLEDIKKTLNKILEYLNKNLLLLYDEPDLINNIINKYYKDGYMPILCIFLEDFISEYTENNTLDINVSIINNYTNSIDKSIELFNIYYYGVEFEFTGTKTNYTELAAITLYHYIFDKVQKIIDDNYDSSKDTDNEENN